MARINGSAEDNLHFQISIGRPPPPPVASGFAVAPEGERGEKSVERLQGRCSVGEVTIDLALIQKPARTPDKTPLQTVVHRISPLTRVRPSRFFFV